MSARRLVTLVVGGALALSGCAGSSLSPFGDSSLSPAQQSLRSNADSLDAAADELEGCQGSEAIVGALFGATLGALAGAAMGGKDDWAKGAAIGGLGGAALGGGAGYAVGNQNCQYASQQDHLNKRLAEARQEAGEYQRANAAARTVVSQHKVMIARLNEEYRKGQIDSARYRQELASLNDDIAAMRKLIAANDRTLASFRETADAMAAQGLGTGALEQEEAKLLAQRKALEQQLDGLLSAVASVPASARPPVA
jgi:hypothetical protein